MKAGSLYLDGELVPREKVEAKSDRLGDLRGEIYREALPEGPSYLIRELSDERPLDETDRSEEHTSELQSLMRISYAVFCLKKNKIKYDLLIQSTTSIYN